MDNKQVKVGIVGTGIYIPAYYISASKIAEQTGGVWSENAVINKLGINQKPIPGPDDGTQEMGVKAAKDALTNTGIDPREIDLIMCMGEEYKEYPLTTSAIYIQEKIGATNAWGIDVQQRCGTTISCMKMAKDMLIADEEVNTVMIVGGYRNGDLIDYRDPSLSFMFNLGAGAGAIILKKNHEANELLGTHIMTDGSLARDVAVEYGGTVNPINETNCRKAAKSLRVFDEKHMKDRLNEVSIANWMHCINQAFEKSGVSKKDLSFLASLHFKKSMHDFLLEELGLSQEQSIYLSDYGHIGQVDQILSIHLANRQGKLREGSIISMIAAGIGYAWNANVIRWGKIKVNGHN
ncbi:3-oxoacyl-ACP synthase [Carboxylicivirga taeanensis]|uniref:3-oxoacyl-ACP synthase n=1 Tax=Carboxylicivirga taeanensis TaxID=1416875 RepID=UPI003F6E3E00